MVRRSQWLVLNFGLLALVLVGVVGFGLWLWQGNLEESVTGVGELQPTANLRRVMVPRAGVIAKVMVQEGQLVRAGQPLFALDPEMNSVQASMLSEALGQLHQERQALHAALQGQGNLPGASPVQAAWLSAFQSEQAAQRNSAELEIKKNQHLYNEALQEQEAQKTVLASREKLLAQYRALEADGGLSKRDLLVYEQDVMTQRGQLAALQETIQSRAMALAQSQQNLGNIQAHANRNLLEQVNDRQRRSIELTGEMAKTHAVQKYEVITAPIDGIVNEQAIYGAGEVVEAGATVLSLVPQNTPFIAEIKVPHQDLAYIRPQQQVALRIEAFPAEQFGRLFGTIQSISPSTQLDAQGKPYFMVRIMPEKQWMKALEGSGAAIPLKSGMTLTADIITRHKTILSFFTEPLHWHFDRAFRDPSIH